MADDLFPNDCNTRCQDKGKVFRVLLDMSDPSNKHKADQTILANDQDVDIVYSRFDDLSFYMQSHKILKRTKLIEVCYAEYGLVIW